MTGARAWASFRPCIVLSGCLVLPAATAAQSGVFRSAIETIVGGRGYDLAVADADADGVDDVLVATTDGLVVLTGRASGELDPPVRTRLSDTVSSLTLADLVGDANADVVAALPDRSRLVVWRGLGQRQPLPDPGGGADRFFAASGIEVDFATPPLASAIADFDGDGRLDVAVSLQGFVDSATGTLVVLAGDENVGLRRLDGAVDLGVGARQIAVADVDLDGRPDVVVLEIGDSTVRVLRGNGDGTFAAPAVSDLASSSGGMTVAELDATPGVELVVSAVEMNGIDIFDIAADGSLVALTSVDSGAGPAAVRAADVDGDGDDDLLVANQRSHDVAIIREALLPDATVGRFVAGDEPMLATLAAVAPGAPAIVALSGGAATAAVNLVLPRLPSGTFRAVENVAAAAVAAIAVQDFDGDGDADVVVAAGTRLAVHDWRSAGSEIIAARDFAAGVSWLAPLSIGDRPHVAVAVAGDETVRVVAAAGDGFADAGTIALSFVPSVVASGDFNGDGLADIAAAGTAAGRVAIAVARSAGGFAAPIENDEIDSPFRLAAIDAICDGRDDLVVLDEMAARVVLTRLSAGVLRVEQTIDGNDSGPTPRSMAVADFDMDGRDDLAVGNDFAGDSRTVRFLRGTCAGSLNAASTQSRLLAGATVRALAAVDIDGDLQVDVIAANGSANSVRAFLGFGSDAGGSPLFFTRPSDGVSRQPEALAAGDFNGDGLYDAVTANFAASEQNLSFLIGCSAETKCDPFSEPIGQPSLRGDANGDAFVSAADLVRLAEELSDGDSQRASAAAARAVKSSPGTDANGDARVDGEDIAAIARRIFANGAR